MNKIMVVDNDTMMLEFMSDLLQNKGHQVKTAKDGLAALETLETYIPDIMFVDLVMPNISGEKLCRAIRRNPEFNGIYIIILSAIAAELEIDFTEIGANACMAKGSFNKMSEQILNVLDRVNKKVPDDTTKKTIGLEDVRTRKINKELLSFRRHSEAILNNLSEGILELNLNNKVIYANHFAHLITDISEEDLLGSYFTELFEDPHQMRVKAMIDLIDKGPQKISEDLPVMLKGKMVSLSILPVNDEEHKSIIVILNDVTERKKAEQALAEQKEFSEKMIENSAVPTFVINTQHEVILWNKACEELTGIKAAEMIGTDNHWKGFYDHKRPHVADIVVDRTPGSMSDYYGNYKKSAFAEEGLQAEGWYANLGGKKRYIFFDAAPIYSSKGELVGAIETLHDITDRRHATDALRNSEKKYRDLYDFLPIPVYEMDLEANITSANKAMYKAFGYNEEDIEKGLNARQILSSEDIDKSEANIRRLLSEEKTEGTEYTLKRKDGSLFPAIIISSINTLWGKPRDIRGVVVDITDRKLFEHELNKTTEKLRKNLIGTMQTISLTIETRDPYTAGHQKEVSKLARSIAQEIGLSADTIDNIRMAGAIHDIGKMAVPAEILSKPGKLTNIEMSLIKTHAESGYNILKDAELPYPIAEITLQHHERMDGSGYPNGLKGDQILLEARIICVADVVEAISSHRPYRPSLGIEIALEEIEKNRGLFYDAQIADACLRLFREKGYKMGGGS
jgi:PAS domain S-box-containing protein/putative nucleotidyltransferase with HDIG domain